MLKNSVDYNLFLFVTYMDLFYYSFNLQEGYSLRGSKERSCRLDQSWSGIEASCEGVVNVCNVLI